MCCLVFRRKEENRIHSAFSVVDWFARDRTLEADSGFECASLLAKKCSGLCGLGTKGADNRTDIKCVAYFGTAKYI